MITTKSSSIPPAARYLSAGECAVVVEYGSIVDPVVHDRVLALDAAVAKAAIKGVTETVPTYRSLMVHFDPLQISQAELICRLQEIEVASTSSAAIVARSRWLIPICYEGDCAEDLVELAEKLGMSPERIVSLHSSAVFRIYMYGFAPGYIYIGGNPRELWVPRRLAPRPSVAIGAVVTGPGGQSGIYPCSLPTGFYVIGRTPERLFVLSRSPIFLVQPGDELVVEQIDRTTFDALSKKEVEAGRTVIRRVG
jgi:KipI family sensor histidine kinase inhibitor